MSLGLENFSVNSDFLELVDAVKKGVSNVYWNCSTVLDDILSLLASCEGCDVSFVCRKSNLAADWLAKNGVEKMCLLGWVCTPPSSLCRILLLDCGLQDEATGVG